MAKRKTTEPAGARHVCIRPGLSVTGVAAARTFAPGDVVDLDAIVATRPGGQAITWRAALGRYLESHFAPVQTSAAEAPVVDETAADDPPE